MSIRRKQQQSGFVAERVKGLWFVETIGVLRFAQNDSKNNNGGMGAIGGWR